MKPEELKQDGYVKWTADRMFKGWDTYGQVIKLTSGRARIKTFDDFSETWVSIKGEAVSDEMSPATKEEVRYYIEHRKIKLAGRKSEIELNAKREIGEIDALVKNLDECLNKEFSIQ